MMHDASNGNADRVILLINGPNLNLLGTREPDKYGTVTLDEIEQSVEQRAVEIDPGVTVEAFQSNHEGEIIDFIHESGFGAAGIIINPGAFTHYSYAIRDALSAVDRPVVEVHISNIHKRESFRHVSVTAPIADGQIFGFGPAGYLMALEYLLSEMG